MSHIVHARKKGEKWSYRFEIAPVDGTRKWICRGRYNTREEAIEAGKKVQEEYENGGSIFEPKNISYSDYLDEWIRDLEGIRSPSTLSSYSSAIKLYIKPQLGHYRLASITIHTLSKFVWYMIKEYSFAEGYYKSFIKVITKSLKDACNNYGYIDKNPSLGLSLPNNVDYGDSREKHMFTAEEFDKIAEYFKERDKPFVMACYLARFTGLRTGEVYALTWNDIDFDNDLIYVRHSVGYIENKDIFGRMYYGPVKTPNGERVIPLLPTLKSQLLKYKCSQDEMKTILGNKYKHYHLVEIKSSGKKSERYRIVLSKEDNNEDQVDFIVTREDGKYVGPDLNKYPFQIIRNKLGITDCRFYDNRATFMTELYYSGVKDDTLISLVGHKSIDTTKKYYVVEKSDVILKEKKKAMAKIESILATPDMKEQLTQLS